jgi:hypothetical protein
MQPQPVLTALANPWREMRIVLAATLPAFLVLVALLVPTGAAAEGAGSSVQAGAGRLLTPRLAARRSRRRPSGLRRQPGRQLKRPYLPSVMDS